MPLIQTGALQSARHEPQWAYLVHLHTANADYQHLIHLRVQTRKGAHFRQLLSPEQFQPVYLVKTRLHERVRVTLAKNLCKQKNMVLVLRTSILSRCLNMSCRKFCNSCIACSTVVRLQHLWPSWPVKLHCTIPRTCHTPSSRTLRIHRSRCLQALQWRANELPAKVAQQRWSKAQWLKGLKFGKHYHLQSLSSHSSYRLFHAKACNLASSDRSFRSKGKHRSKMHFQPCLPFLLEMETARNLYLYLGNPCLPLAYHSYPFQWGPYMFLSFLALTF